MRTTVSVDDHLLASAKQRAHELGITLGELVERALRLLLSADGSPGEPPPTVPTFRRGEGVRPGVDLTSTRALLESIDEGQPLERLR
jgi:hypothetical protein